MDKQNILKKLLEHSDFHHFSEEPQAGHFRPISKGGNTHHLDLSVKGLYDHKQSKYLGGVYQLAEERGLIKKNLPEHIYTRSASSAEDMEIIKAYFKSRALDIGDKLIKEMGLKVNRYKGDLMIVAPLRGIGGNITQLSRIFLDPKTYKKTDRKLIGKATTDRAVFLKRGRKLTVFEGLEDGLTYYLHSGFDDSVLVCFGIPGLKKIESFMEGFDEVELLLDPDPNDQSLKASSVLEEKVSRKIPTLGDKIDANAAWSKGVFKKWLNSLKKVAWPEVKKKSGNQKKERFEIKQKADNKKSFNLTDMGNGERLAHYYGHKLRYCHAFKSWLIWNGKCWEKDKTDQIIIFAKETARKILEEAVKQGDEDKRKKLVFHHTQSEKITSIKAMIEAANPLLSISPKELDQNKWLLNCQSGTVNLKTGKLQKHDKLDYITKILPFNYDENAACSDWKLFLSQVTKGDKELVEYIQKAVGYSLTGEISEQCLFFLYGKGQNGKSTFLNAITKLFSGYYEKINIETLKQTKNKHSGSYSADIAKLNGKRFVVASEIQRDMKFNEALAKDMTGGDILTARHLYKEEFKFFPELTLWLYGNYKPNIIGNDLGIWRRIRLIPFDATIQKPDKALPDKLEKELTGILKWAIEGCLKWQSEGLRPPDIISEATDSYKKEMDVVGKFVSERCLPCPEPDLRETLKYRVKATKVYRHFLKWCEESDEKLISEKEFKQGMEARDFQKEKKSGEMCFLGITLKDYDKAE